MDKRIAELTRQLEELGETEWCSARSCDAPAPVAGTRYFGVWNGAGYEKFFLDREQARALTEAGGEGYELMRYGTAAGSRPQQAA